MLLEHSTRSSSPPSPLQMLRTPHPDCHNVVTTMRAEAGRHLRACRPGVQSTSSPSESVQDVLLTKASALLSIEESTMTNVSIVTDTTSMTRRLPATSHASISTMTDTFTQQHRAVLTGTPCTRDLPHWPHPTQE